MNDCITCLMFNQFDTVANSYALQAFDAVAPWAQTCFNAFVGVWAAWVFISMMTGAAINWRETGLQAAGLVATGVVLSGSGFYWEWVYEPTRALMSGLTQMMVQAPAAGVSDTSMAGLLGAVENEVFLVFTVVLALLEDSSFYELLNLVAGVVLMLPYVFVWGIFLAFMLEGIFKLLGVTALAPVFIALIPFKITRGFSMSAARVLINGVLTVVFAGVAMGFTITIIKIYTGKFPVNEYGDFTINADDFVFSGEYFAILLIGFISVLFHLKAATLASNISGASDGPGAASAVVAAGMAGMAAVKGAAMMPAKPIMDEARRRYGKAGADLGAAAVTGAGKAIASGVRAGASQLDRLTSRLGR